MFAQLRSVVLPPPTERSGFGIQRLPTGASSLLARPAIKSGSASNTFSIQRQVVVCNLKGSTRLSAPKRKARFSVNSGGGSIAATGEVLNSGVAGAGNCSDNLVQMKDSLMSASKIAVGSFYQKL